MARRAGLSELSEQIELVGVLTRAGLLFCAVPNGGRRNRIEAARLKAAGVQSGVPDLLIFTPPPAGGEGCALELKKEGDAEATPKQQQWLEALAARGWRAIVAHGCVDAIRQLRDLGYRV